ncbi:unnamed protein product [Pipistrellus nathusii]|uniref:Uncharacterized protein n=1 Tax=Pipistrellus nathusii TaxID=59473 RepID=A0ABP0ALK0_PIPNA
MVKCAMKFCVNLDELSLWYNKLKITYKVGLEEIEILPLSKGKKYNLGLLMIKEGNYSVLHPPSKEPRRIRQKVFVNMLYSCSVLMPYVDKFELLLSWNK